MEESFLDYGQRLKVEKIITGHHPTSQRTTVAVRNDVCMCVCVCVCVCVWPSSVDQGGVCMCVCMWCVYVVCVYMYVNVCMMNICVHTLHWQCMYICMHHTFQHLYECVCT